MTTQIIPGSGYADPLPLSATTEFNSVYGGYIWDIENVRKQLVAAPGVISRLRVWLSADPGAGNTYTFTLRRGVGAGAMANTALTVTLGVGETTKDDLVNTVNLAADDLVSISVTTVEGGTLPTNYAQWCWTWTPTTTDECLLMAGGYTVQSAYTSYNAVVGSGANWASAATEYAKSVVVPTAGTIRDLYVRLSADPGDTGVDGYIFTLRRSVGDGNTMLDTALTVTIMADNVAGNDVAHDITVAAGDVISMECEPVSVPAVTPIAWYGMVFVPDTTGEFPVLGVTYSATISDDTARFNPPGTNYGVWAAGESTSCTLMENCTIKKFYVWINTPIGAGQLDVNVRDDTASVLDVTIAAGDTGNSGAQSQVLAAGINHIAIRYFATAGTTVTNISWGFLGYNANGAPPSVIGSNIVPLVLGFIREGIIT